MALEKRGDWILGKDYSAAPTCATCHVSGYVTPTGEVKGNSHDVGDRISWTLRPIVSTKINRVIFEDGTQEDYPDTRQMPAIGSVVETTHYQVKEDLLTSGKVPRTVARVSRTTSIGSVVWPAATTIGSSRAVASPPAIA